jgi:uncharacterized protein (TIGR00255 family)
MIQSMTGFADARGADGGYAWTWDLRSVNARGLDLRMRLPDWIDGLEAAARKALSAALQRGNVSLSLRITRTETAGVGTLDPAALSASLSVIAAVEAEAGRSGLALAPTRATDILSLRGVYDTSARDAETNTLSAKLLPILISELDDLIAAFLTMRQAEGQTLAGVLATQVDRIDGLTEAAAAVAETRRDQMAAALRRNVDRVLEATDAADPERLAQEIALLVVKSDVTEELDRLRAHIAAARDLLGKGGAVGRRLDFLMQEFNREANTLCAKAQSSELTALGLDLKTVIDQMREQVQNIE